MSKFRIASVFSDRMVLQRNKNINIFGDGEDGAVVTVSFEGNTAKAVVKNGSWNVVLPPHSAGENYEMTISCGEYEKKFTDIAVGEVWLAGGQSNMEFELQNCTTGKQHLENDKGVNVRFYYTQKNAFVDEKFLEDEAKMAWQKFEGDSPKCWSAVGYIFAKGLSEKLGCVVGVIGCNWGGTKACHWMSRESLTADSDMRYDLDLYDKAVEGKTAEELDRIYQEYVDYHTAWEKKSAEYYTTVENPTWDGCLEYCGENKYPGPLAPRNPFHATGLYESMIKRVSPYTIAGFIYYQGESDDDRPQYYYKMLRGLITLWREDWGDDLLPFLIVQLPMHRYSGDSDRKHWCLIREAQEKAYHTIRNTGLAVVLDCGEFNEIHPKDKEQVAHRLCMQAMSVVYGDNNPKNTAPLYKSHIVKDGGIEVSFFNADGFKLTGEKCGFEISGIDGEYKPADFEIRGDKILVFGDVSDPVNVRYQWTNYAEVTLFEEQGLPLAPFRTDRN